MKKFKSFSIIVLCLVFLASSLNVFGAVAGENETNKENRDVFTELNYQVIANTITVSGRTPYADTLVSFWLQENTDPEKTLFVYQHRSDSVGEFALKFIVNPSIYDADGANDATLRVGGENINIQRIDNIPLYSETEMTGCRNAFADISDVDSFDQFFGEYSDMLGVEGGYSVEELEILYGYYQKNLPEGDESLEEIIEILSDLADKLTRHQKLVADVSSAATGGDASEIRRLLLSENYKDLIEINDLDFGCGQVIKEADMWARMVNDEGYESLEEIQEAFIAAREAQTEVDKQFGGPVTTDREMSFNDNWKVSNVANLITVSGSLDVDAATPINVHVSGVDKGVSPDAEDIIAFANGKAVKTVITDDHVDFKIQFPLNTSRFGGETVGCMRISAKNVNIHQFYITLYAQDEIDALIDQFKEIDSVDDLRDFIEDNKSKLEITGNFDDDKLAVMYELFEEREYDDISDSRSLASSVDALINDTDAVLDFIDDLNTSTKSGRWGKVLEVIQTKHNHLSDISEGYEDLLDLVKKAERLENVRGVYQRLLGQSFTRVQDVVDNFTEAYEAQKDEEAAVSSRPSGGGGGGGGGSSFAPIITGDGGGEQTEMIIGEGVIVEDITKIPEKDLPAAPFTDLAGYDWAKSAIDSLRQKNIIKGDGTGIFRPADEMTREEYLSVLLKTMNVEIKSGTVPFSDVDPNEWYADVVATAYSLGITNGMGDGRFGVGEKVVRADMVVLAARLARKLGKNIEKKEAATIFADYAIIPDYAYEDVVAFQQADLINGDESKNFNPAENTTRAEAAVFFWNIFSTIK